MRVACFVLVLLCSRIFAEVRYESESQQDGVFLSHDVLDKTEYNFLWRSNNLDDSNITNLILI